MNKVFSILKKRLGKIPQALFTNLIGDLSHLQMNYSNDFAVSIKSSFVISVSDCFP